MAGKHYPPVVSPEDNPLYHDTYKLLRCYRDSTYSLKVAVRQVEIQFQLEYKTSRRISGLYLCCWCRLNRKPDRRMGKKHLQKQ